MKNPLIFDFCTSRRGDDRNLVYCYDIDKNLNVINLAGETIPFVNCGIPNGEMLSQNYIGKISKVECSGDRKMLQSVVELETETRVWREGADADSYGYLLELMTKTEVVPERDEEE